MGTAYGRERTSDAQVQRQILVGEAAAKLGEVRVSSSWEFAVFDLVMGASRSVLIPAGTDPWEQGDNPLYHPAMSDPPVPIPSNDDTFDANTMPRNAAWPCGQ